MREAYIAQLDQAKVFPQPIVTQVVPLKAFYPAEAYHQDYAAHHPDQLYIVYNDAPKVAHLRQQFPELYTGKVVRSNLVREQVRGVSYVRL